MSIELSQQLVAVAGSEIDPVTVDSLQKDDSTDGKVKSDKIEVRVASKSFIKAATKALREMLMFNWQMSKPTLPWRWR
eukprot:6273930-Karenia_brevis.AAC.1